MTSYKKKKNTSGRAQNIYRRRWARFHYVCFFVCRFLKIYGIYTRDSHNRRRRRHRAGERERERDGCVCLSSVGCGGDYLSPFVCLCVGSYWLDLLFTVCDVGSQEKKNIQISTVKDFLFTLMVTTVGTLPEGAPRRERRGERYGVVCVCFLFVGVVVIIYHHLCVCVGSLARLWGLGCCLRSRKKSPSSR